MPTHDPDQLVKALPVAGAAVRVTCVSASNDGLQTLPQLMPAGVDVTVPDPEPALTTVTTGRAFFTVRLSDGSGPSVPSVSPAFVLPCRAMVPSIRQAATQDGYDDGDGSL